MNIPARTWLNVVIPLLLAGVVYLSVSAILHARKVRDLMVDRAEIKHVRYGLLNMEEWTEKTGVILGKKISEMEITPENSEAILEGIEGVLHMLIDEVEAMMLDRTTGPFSEVKRWIAGLTFDLDQLRDSVPSYSMQILKELEKPENREAITRFLENKLESYVASTGSPGSDQILRQLLNAYGCSTREECEQLLTGQIVEQSAGLRRMVVLIVFLAVAIFLLVVAGPVRTGFLMPLWLFLALGALLTCGVTMPMITLEATIVNLRFQLMGEEVVFGENILFFQSKSITDVVGILIREGTFPMILVGILIFSFSIVFPVLKLSATLGYQVAGPSLKSNTWIRFFVFKSGKWSMADVMVVAIFMAYIGFNGIVGNQLEQLREGTGAADIATSNGTQLMSGFYLFLTYCLLGLFLAERLSRHQRNRLTAGSGS